MISKLITHALERLVRFNPFMSSTESFMSHMKRAQWSLSQVFPGAMLRFAVVISMIACDVAHAQVADPEVLSGRFIREVLDPYARLDQYAGTVLMERAVNVSMPDGTTEPEAGSLEITLEFERDRAVRMVSSLSELRYAAGSVSMHVPTIQLYSRQDAEWNDLYELLGRQGPMLEWHPLAPPLMGIKPPLPYLNPDAFSMTSVTEGTVDTATVWVGTVALMGSLPPANVTWHTGANDGRLQKIDVDLRELMRFALTLDPSLEGATVQEAFVRWTFTDSAEPPTAPEFWPVLEDGAWQMVDDLSILLPADTAPSHPLVGRLAPDFTGNTLDGQQVTLSQLRGQVVILDFWATWCSPCIESMPLLEELHRDWKDKGVVVLGVNVEDARARRMIDRFRATHRITFDSVLDPEGLISQEYAVDGIPALFLIDTEGLVQQAHTGFSPDIYTGLRELLPAMVAAGQAPPAP